MKSQETILPLIGRLLILAAVIVFSAALCPAQDQKGIILNMSFGGSSASLGQVYRLYDAVGYSFSKHFEMDAGLPVYFVRASSSGLAQGFTSHNGIGNVFLEFRGIASGADWYFSSNLKGTAPTGNTDNGFSTGRATVDWTNYVERTVGRFTPFGSAGIANTISDTHFFIRPFSSLGLVAIFEGGTNVRIAGPLSLGGSFYADVPSGQQKVYSKLLPQGHTNMIQTRGGHNRPFENQSAVVGSSVTAKDHGVSAWLDFNPAKTTTLEIGYSRSTQYDLDTLFFSVGFDLTRLVKKPIH